METSLNGNRKKMKCRGDGERKNKDMEKWRNGEMEKWKDGETEKWRNEKWKNGEMEKWRDGEMERWRKGRLDGDKNMELRWKWR